jgi:hypothetical protein
MPRPRMSEIRKLEDGKWFRLISRPLDETMLAYANRAGWNQFHNEDDNPDEIWEPCDE